MSEESQLIHNAATYNELWTKSAIEPPPIAVVIPTYNRRVTLLQTLAHLERQTDATFEVVVVDDGSSDDTAAALAGYLPTAPFPMATLRQPNSGPARARNLAVGLLRAPLCILIGDDIFASPQLVAEHLRLHRQHPEAHAAAIGLTRWAEHGQAVTPLMRWLERDGVQFAYAELASGRPATWKHFYTSNLSLKTSLLREHPFHEGFPSAGMEDIELGYRLSVERGLTMDYLPDALAEHLHPTTFARTCRRAVEGGRMYYLFAQMWPEHRHQPPRNPLRRLALALLSHPRVVPALRWTTEQLTRIWCPNPLLKPLLMVLDRNGYALEARARAQP